MKRGLLLLLGLALFGGLSFSVWWLVERIEPGARRAPGLRRAALLSLRIGMDEEEVVAALGQPLAKLPDADQRGTAFVQPRRVVWRYATPGWLDCGFESDAVMIEGRLTFLGVEQYDLGVYRCDLEACPAVWNEEALRRLP